MRRKALQEMLAAVHARENRLSPVFQDRLERELVARHRQTYGRTRTPLFRSRACIAAALILIVAIGSVPSSHAEALGAVLRIETSAQNAPEVAEILRFLEASHAADEISASVSRGEEGRTSVLLILFGMREAPLAIVARLNRQYAALAQGQAEVIELEGSIRSTLAGRVARRVLSFGARSRVNEEARQQVLAELARVGFDHAGVMVNGNGTHRRIEVRLGE